MVIWVSLWMISLIYCAKFLQSGSNQNDEPTDSDYIYSPTSAFPFLPIAEVPGLIEQSKTIGQRAAVR
jgi:hypothetical protein